MLKGKKKKSKKNGCNFDNNGDDIGDYNDIDDDHHGNETKMKRRKKETRKRECEKNPLTQEAIELK